VSGHVSFDWFLVATLTYAGPVLLAAIHDFWFMVYLCGVSGDGIHNPINVVSTFP